MTVIDSIPVRAAAPAKAGAETAAEAGATNFRKAPSPAPPVDACVAVGAAHPRPDGQDRYTIGEVAECTGLSAPTLRWYEEIGLMPHVERSRHGQRVYGNHDLDWLAFVTKLRLTGMPVADMVHFADLVRRGEATYGEREEILRRTRRDVLARIAELRETVTVLDCKIDFYGSARRAQEGA